MFQTLTCKALRSKELDFVVASATLMKDEKRNLLLSM